MKLIISIVLLVRLLFTPVFAQTVANIPCGPPGQSANQAKIKYIIQPGVTQYRYQVQVNLNNKGFVPVMNSTRAVDSMALSDNNRYLGLILIRGPWYVLYVNDLQLNRRRKLKTFDHPLKTIYFSDDSRCIYYEDKDGQRNLVKLPSM